MIDKEKKEFAERLRDMVKRTDMIVAETREEHPPMLSVDPREVLALADTLDPPRPEPGTVVCEYHIPFGILQDAILQFVGIENGEIQYNNLHVAVRITQDANIARMTIPARILAPDEVAVTIPPVSEWPKSTQIVKIWAQYTGGLRGDHIHTITRAEAERMEANQ